VWFWADWGRGPKIFSSCGGAGWGVNNPAMSGSQQCLIGREMRDFFLIYAICNQRRWHVGSAAETINST